jgi:hypothetical protein
MSRFLFVCAAIGLGGLFAQEPTKGKAITLTGLVVDTGCYLSHDSKGADHAACAAACAKNGSGLAILDDSAKLYMPIAADHKNQNLKLMPFTEKRVNVEGTLLEKAGLSGIAIKAVSGAE